MIYRPTCHLSDLARSLILYKAFVTIQKNNGLSIEGSITPILYFLICSGFWQLNFSEVWTSGGDLLLYNQILCLFEVLHPAIGPEPISFFFDSFPGLTRGGVVPALTQVTGRGHQFLLVTYFVPQVPTISATTAEFLFAASVVMVFHRHAHRLGKH